LPHDGFQIATERQGANAHVRLAGEFDIAAVEKFEAELRQVEQESPSEIVIDLSSLTFIDSSGLRMLLQVDREARQNGFDLVLLGPAQSVRRVFETTGLVEHLPIVDRLGEPPTPNGR
jgi:anti-sigma B factor antagonist